MFVRTINLDILWVRLHDMHIINWAVVFCRSWNKHSNIAHRTYVDRQLSIIWLILTLIDREINLYSIRISIFFSTCNIERGCLCICVCTNNITIGIEFIAIGIKCHFRSFRWCKLHFCWLLRWFVIAWAWCKTHCKNHCSKKHKFFHNL